MGKYEEKIRNFVFYLLLYYYNAMLRTRPLPVSGEGTSLKLKYFKIYSFFIKKRENLEILKCKII